MFTFKLNPWLASFLVGSALVGGSSLAQDGQRSADGTVSESGADGATPATEPSATTPPNGAPDAVGGPNANADRSCPAANASDPVSLCARKSCQTIQACKIVATHAENKSSLASGEVADQFKDSPDMALSAFQFSAVASDSSQWLAQAAKYCTEKPLHVCQTACDDKKAPDKKDKIKALRESCTNAINAEIKTLTDGVNTNAAAKAGATDTATNAGATPQSASPSGDASAKPAGSAAHDQASSGAGAGSGAGGGGMGGMPQMPQMPQSQNSNQNQTPASTQPDCTYDMSSPTCVTQWTSQCATGTYALSSACQSFMGGHCVGATLHSPECIEAKTMQVCADPVGATGCPVCLQRQGIPVNALQSTQPAICNQIPAPAAVASSTTTAAGASSSSPASSSSNLNTSSIKTQSLPSLGADSLVGADLSLVKRTTASESAEGRPATDVEKANGLGVMSITAEVLSKFCKGSTNPSCTGQK